MQPATVVEAEHQAWFTDTLAREDRELFIVLGDGQPIGMVRFDSLGDHWEMSWSLAPEKRGLGWGKRLVSEGARLKEGNLVARIKRRNPASERIAHLAGFCFVEEKDGVGHWRRDKN
jgi:RimJ/RimL family protein N-acetyltransferase